MAQRYPASREVLAFFAEIASFQGDLAATLPPKVSNPEEALDSLLPGRQILTTLVEAKGPQQLREEARKYDETACRRSVSAYLRGIDIESAPSFFARVLLQPAMHAWDRSALNLELPNTVSKRPGDCSRCGHAPQAGVLRPHGDGASLSLVCSLCLHERPFTRLKCPGCGEDGHQKLSFYATAEFPHLEVQVCESCKVYLHLVHIEKDTNAVADVDELAALPLDVWAQERGYRKMQTNMGGM